MDREPPRSVVCTNLAKSAKNSLAKMFQNFQILFKNFFYEIPVAVSIYIAPKRFFQKNVVLGGIFHR
jgi:membrane protein insertase Oxa1/YidC/SpoIIIJ